jgi:hypothetical protein
VAPLYRVGAVLFYRAAALADKAHELAFIIGANGELAAEQLS